MAMTLDPATKVFTINQADLTLVTGTLYSADTDALRREMMSLLASEDYIWMEDSFFHNTEVTIAGVTYARTIGTLNGYSYTFSPDSQWSVRLEGSNNDFWDIEAGNLNQNQVQVIPTNSAGLQTVVSGSGVTPGDITDIENAIFDRVVESGDTFEEITRLLRAAAAGSIVEQPDGSYVIKSKDGVTDRIVGDDAANGGRTISTTDGT